MIAFRDVDRPERFPDLNTQGAQRLVDWLVSENGQSLIGAYEVKGKVLFKPNARKNG